MVSCDLVGANFLNFFIFDAAVKKPSDPDFTRTTFCFLWLSIAETDHLSGFISISRGPFLLSAARLSCTRTTMRFSKAGFYFLGWSFRWSLFMRFKTVSMSRLGSSLSNATNFNSATAVL